MRNFIQVINSKIAINVRYGETDGMAISYHPNYFKWFELGRVQLLKDINLDYKFIESQGLGLPVLEAYAQFIKPTIFDDHLMLETVMKRLPSAVLRLDYQLKREDTLVTKGYTTHAFMDTHKKPVKPPLFFWNVLKTYFPDETVTLPI